MSFFWISLIVMSLAAIGFAVAPFLLRLKTNNQPNNQLISSDIKTAILLVIFIPLCATLFYHYFGHEKQLASWYDRQAKELLVKKTLARYGSAENIINRFKLLLTTHPNQPKGWYLLGRVYTSQGHYALASQAFAKAHNLAPDNVQISLNYLQALFYQHQGKLNKIGLQLANTILAKTPHNNLVINLLATNAYRKGNYKVAVRDWEQLLPYYPPNTQDGKVLLKAIAKAQQHLHSPS